jgi:hypothetical protein
MPNEYRHNHYVPAWYQKRFMMPGQKNNELFYLDLKPGFLVDGRVMTLVPFAGRSELRNGARRAHQNVSRQF